MISICLEKVKIILFPIFQNYLYVQFYQIDVISTNRFKIISQTEILSMTFVHPIFRDNCLKKKYYRSIWKCWLFSVRWRKKAAMFCYLIGISFSPSSRGYFIIGLYRKSGFVWLSGIDVIETMRNVTAWRRYSQNNSEDNWTRTTTKAHKSHDSEQFVFLER